VIGEPDVSEPWLWRTAIIALLVSGLASILPARSDTLDVFAELQQQLSAKKFVDAEQTATQLLKDDPKSPLAGRVLSARALSRFEQGRVPDAVEDYLTAINQAESSQRRAAVYLELASAMLRLNYGDHACAAIRRAIDAAGADASPIWEVAVAMGRRNGCPDFADQNFARLFELPFRMTGATQGVLGSILGDAAAVRFPSDWAIDPAAQPTTDATDLSSGRKDAMCAIRRVDGTAPIQGYLEAVSREIYSEGPRPGGILSAVVGRESRMGTARAVEVDFSIGTRPGRLYLATRLGMTYSVLCLELQPGGARRMRDAAELIVASMRWRT
jgi:hypothetical protein